MKVHTIARDVKQMQLAELEAINRRVAEVQAIPTDNGTVDQSEAEAEEAPEKEESPKAPRPKKNKARVRSN